MAKVLNSYPEFPRIRNKLDANSHAVGVVLLQHNIFMSLRIRHCVQCPKCHTCYLIAFSPYRNGSYLMRTGTGSTEEYVLYCFCEGAQAPNRGRWRDVKPCIVSKAAHERGYGSLDEVWLRNPPAAP